MDVRQMADRIAVVTGAASGIGRASALAVARRGGDLALCDLDEAALEATAEQIRTLGRRVHTRRVDVADRAAMEAFASEVYANLGAVDVLMNNAGVGLAATFADSTLDDWQWLLGINLLGVVHGCHFFVPRMIAGGRGGHVVNVASMAAFVPSEQLCAYSTSKFAVLGFSEALRLELRPHGIGVTALCPGVVKSGIVHSSRGRGRGDAPEVRQRIAEAYERRNYGPERVAEDMLRAIQRNRGVAPSSPEAWFAYYLKRLAPPLIAWLSRIGQRRLFAQAP